MTHTCPRRKETGHDRGDSPFVGSGQNLDKYRDDNTCSYCGSLNPELFIALLWQDNVTIGTTDKNYKIYLKSPELKMSCPKFYFQHFTKEQIDSFIDLMNTNRLKFESDIGFYVLPFFCREVKE